MGWLVSQVVTSMLGAVIIVKIFDIIIGGLVGPAAHAAKTSIFVSVWTGITTVTGMRAFTKAVRGLRQRNKEVGERIDLLHKDKR